MRLGWSVKLNNMRIVRHFCHLGSITLDSRFSTQSRTEGFLDLIHNLGKALGTRFGLHLIEKGILRLQVIVCHMSQKSKSKLNFETYQLYYLICFRKLCLWVIFQYYFMRISNLFRAYSPRCRTLTMFTQHSHILKKVIEINIFTTNSSVWLLHA